MIESAYGSWRSPITADLIASASIRLGEVRVDNGSIYWLEGRPLERGRTVLVRADQGGRMDCLPAEYNCRTTVHEYGGGSYTLRQGHLCFSNFADQRLYYKSPTALDPIPLTPEGGYRFADAVIDLRGQQVISVREDHTTAAPEPINTLVRLGLDGSSLGGVVLTHGYDFYAAPRLSPDGSRLAWICWNHPQMPWDGTELWVADLRPDGSLQDAVKVAGGTQESIVQPEWSPHGELFFVSDRSNWWNLYRWDGHTVQAVWSKEAEFGLPQWVFGQSTYAFVSESRLVCTYSEQGIAQLAVLPLTGEDPKLISTPFTHLSSLQSDGEQVVFLGGSPTQPLQVVTWDLQTGTFQTWQRATELTVDPDYFSVPEPIEFPTEQGLSAYAFYYPPKNKDYRAPASERPPLLVKSHGGPTGSTSTVFNLGIQFWTSRGFAVLDVNYGGSTGYGRAYQQRLQGQWGIVDVDDCVNGALYLVEQGLADRQRLAIDGGSAGGYTTLCSLTFKTVFRAGASYYGVSDLEALAQDTHKFESRYLDGLIGPYPQRRDLYQQRSPIHSTQNLDCPVIFFQGLEDKVVPPNQAEAMVTVLRQKGLPVAYLAFAGEQHGFRQAATLQKCLESELYFYAQVFGFHLADPPKDPVVIENLPD